MKASEIAEKLFEIEKELNLFEKQIQGVYFWKLVRFQVFMQLTQKLGIYEQAHTQEFNSIFDKIKAVVPRVKNTYLHSVFSRSTKIDVLVVEHGRKVLIDNEYVDIYTKYKVKELEKDNISFEIVDRPHLGKHYHKPSKKRSYFENITINFLVKSLLKKTALNDDEISLVKKIEKKINKEFNIDFQLSNQIEKRIRVFKAKKQQYKNMLKKRCVKQVYLVVSYGHEPFIAACKETGVECIELQHGTMNYFHVGYSFPYNKKVKYFPEKIEIFGKYWQDSTPLPLESKNMKISGYPYLNSMLEKYKNLEKQKNKVLFISQGTVASELSKIAFEMARENPQLEVYYKLHPGEFGRWKTDYIYLKEAIKLNNFYVIEKEIHLYELMATSEFLVGVYSTAIFEGLTLQCKTILIDLPGIEFVDYLLKEDIAKLAKNTKDMLSFIENDNFKKVEKDYFFMAEK